MKKFTTLIIAIAMMATVMTGCGVDAPDSDVFKKYETETSTDKKNETVEDKKDAETDADKKSDADKSDKESDDKKSEDKTEAADKSEDKNSNADKTQSSNTGNNSSNTGSKPVDTQDKTPSKPVEPTKPVHTHSYNATVTANASCTANGVKTYTCSCGDSYTESIPATGHNWVDQVKSWTEQVWVDGTPGTISCKCACGQIFDYNGWQSHTIQAASNREYGHGSFSEVELGGTEGYYKNVDHNDHYSQCANCGATQ